MKIKLITPDARHAEAWMSALSAEPALQAHPIVRPLRDVNVLVNGSRPDMVVAETMTPQDFEALERLAAAHPEVDYVLVGNELSPEFLMRAMRVGVREVLPAPASAEAVLAALRRQLRKRAPVQAGAHEPGRVFAFVSCKGGSGATFAAANLAHMLADGGQRRVALIDMNLQFGDAALFVSSERPVSNVADVAHNIARLDADLLRSAMNQVAPGLWVLAAPDDPAHAADVTPAHVEAIVHMAQGMFDFVVIDAGRSLSAVSLQALDLADRVFAVLQLTLPFIRDGKRLRDVFRSLDYPEDKIQWIVNRYQKGGQLTLEDLQKTLGLRQVLTLPNQYEVVAASVNQGVPVDSIAPGSAIARALRELAEAIAPGAAQPQRGKWLTGLFRATH
ncbi:AAA family ATPase [Methylibium rhizosphaerae]|uniref:AAA family ATPase n=1 Tax=Methylibium rhizosphaerae TaxID=2570323 RepID=UPI0015E2BF4F|nr:AAA family ATPase [Methylibium rhizosphaerae]